MPYFTAPLRPEHPRLYSQPSYEGLLNPFLAALLSEQPHEASPSSARQREQQPAQKKPKTAAASATKPNPTPKNPHRSVRAFTPNFDVYESETTYTLEGDLPGLSNKKAIDIEFSDDRTLMIRGKVERTVPASIAHRSLKPTVEDTDDEDDFTVVDGDKKSEKSEEKPEEKEEVVGEMKTWLNERTFGSFQRSFTFPTPVNIEEVKAQLENGVLRVHIPKVVQKGMRKIVVE